MPCSLLFILLTRVFTSSPPNDSLKCGNHYAQIDLRSWLFTVVLRHKLQLGCLNLRYTARLDTALEGMMHLETKVVSILCPCSYIIYTYTGVHVSPLFENVTRRPLSLEHLLDSGLHYPFITLVFGAFVHFVLQQKNRKCVSNVCLFVQHSFRLKNLMSLHIQILTLLSFRLILSAHLSCRSHFSLLP